MSIGSSMFRSRSAPSPSSSDNEEGATSSYKKLLSRTLTNPVQTMRNMVEEGEDEEEEGAEGDDHSGGNLMTRSIRRKFWRRRGPNPLNLLKLVEGHLTMDNDSGESGSMSDSAQEPFAELEKLELPLPDLLGPTDILTEDHRRSIVKELPARALGYPWTLLYSTSKHGFSLKTLYREMAKVDTPVLLIIQDTKGVVFGAVTSNSLHLSDLFYGTGETFLFTFHPEFLCFPWTGHNEFFMKGDADSLAIGAGDGHFGLWLDGDLFHGRSYPCNTFANLRLNSDDDFVVKALECWGFV